MTSSDDSLVATLAAFQTQLQTLLNSRQEKEKKSSSLIEPSFAKKYGKPETSIWKSLRSLVTSRAAQDAISKTNLVPLTSTCIIESDICTEPDFACEFLGNCVANHDENQLILWGSAFFQNWNCATLLTRSVASTENVRVAHAICMIIHACCVANPSRPVVNERLESLVHNSPLALSSICILAMSDEKHGWAAWIMEATLENWASVVWKSIENNTNARTAFLQIISQASDPVLDSCTFVFERFIEACRAQEAFRDPLEHASLLACAAVCSRNTVPLKTKLDLVHEIVEKLLVASPSAWDDCRPDLLRILANITIDCADAQNLTLEMGGVQAVLNHCKMDPTRPGQQEWALFAVRSLCAGNPEVQRLIDRIRPVAYNGQKQP